MYKMTFSPAHLQFNEIEEEMLKQHIVSLVYLTSTECILVKQFFLNLPIIDLLDLKSLTLPVPDIFPFLKQRTLL